MFFNKLKKIDVSAYSGFRYFERPLEITYRNKKIPITSILERSLEEFFPSGERIYRFRVMCEGNKKFTLFYNINKDEWFLSTQISDFS